MNATFYVLKLENEPTLPVPAHFHLACTLAATLYRKQSRVFIATENIEDAHAIDDYLWAFDADRFVPHNLTGEGPKQGAPVEIGFQLPSSGNRNVLINLKQTVPPFAQQFQQVIDFVPATENEKQQARERYKFLRQMGTNLSTIDINTLE
ncbi:DNA polymerase III subunit chi [Flocculibacter collagenilyticus]|uniref:DNA polymerase III subunit chi n=1 Tax=Flocculibacter collagenilyticus TaxID=2744479 RepID=UPI0018F58F88|nr:DNA polymerase III subunit chi [Flocculibacter collagenilyticus]